ncbi:ion transporter [Nocardioides terrigena]|uniref:ion transporter n=1 Tax=Nocardioides terrigena TaxID=424797 RepID=UPI000D319FEC|nr:ion transporter [Nocardioides terrigena]
MGDGQEGRRRRVQHLVERREFQAFIILVIVVNAALIGVEATPALATNHAEVLRWATFGTVMIFVVEVSLRLYAYGPQFFRSPWNLFDLAVVLISAVPGGSGYSLLRIFRVFRVLRLLSTVRSMRRVVGALVATIPGMASIGALLGIVMYISAVLSTELFGEADPEHFGSLGPSFRSIFQITTGDDWANVVAGVASDNPWAWAFFAAYLIVATYIVLNLFVAVAVEALDRQSDDSIDGVVETVDEVETAVDESTRTVLAELAHIRTRLDELASVRSHDSKCSVHYSVVE